MSNILTPSSLWKDFNDGLDLCPVKLEEKVEDGIKYEYVTFCGRDTGEGRVLIYAVFASSVDNPSADGVLVLPDGGQTVDERLLKMFVENGYSALMVDYRGKWEGAERYTVYPDIISYANFATCGRFKDYVDESADKTSWYEWVAVGIYSVKYLLARVQNKNIAVVGLRDGGEIAWKLAYCTRLACAVTVCAGGWKVYAGYDKFGGEEPELDEERHRFLAGIDSQAYAPYVNCPVLMLCSTNDPDFDYDRAYDTFSRINPEYAEESVISYSVRANACVGMNSLKDMFMFLDRSVKRRNVYVSKPAEITVSVDEDENLIATATFDDFGEVSKFKMFMAEDCINSKLRDWFEVEYKRKKSDTEHEFYLNVYEKTSIVFLLCCVTYTNGFTVWSKIVVKKINGQFRNSQPKSNVLYSCKRGIDCFTIADYRANSIGDTIINSDEVLPKIVTKAKGLKGLYSAGGLSTFRLNSPQFSPRADSIIKLDVCADSDCVLVLIMENLSGGEAYVNKVSVVGGVWQSVLLKSQQFKNDNGKPLSDFAQGLHFVIKCNAPYAINNVMWL